MLIADPLKDPRPNRLINILDKKNITVDILNNNFSKINHPNIRRNYSLDNKKIFNYLYPLKVLLTLLSALKSSIIKNPALPPTYYENYYYISKKIKNKLFNNNYDYIIVEDIVLLSQAIGLFKESKIIFDAREFYEEQGTESIKFNLLIKPIRIAILYSCLKKCNYIFSVSDAIANAYKEKYKVKVDLLRSVPFYSNKKVKKTFKKNIKIVHHGIGYKTRGIKDMIDIVKASDEKYSLDLYLVSDKNYLKEIKNYIGECNRIKLKNPVQYRNIIDMLANYDMGLFFVKPATFNLLNCLPNKLFEFIQARLAVIVSPSPEMRKIIDHYKCGFASKSFEKDSVIDLLNNLKIEDIDSAKQNSNIAAKELCYEKESRNLLSKIINQPTNNF
tara:strand:- start:8435 stop:9598 length:1164 start_codon:yes stop_codon:yes gene_type:complete